MRCSQSDLGNLYFKRSGGDRAENLEKSIACYYSALEVYTKVDTPIDWAIVQSNLANAFLERIGGERVENLKKSIDCYYEALEIINKDNFPLQWATIKNNLADAYIRAEKLFMREEKLAMPSLGWMPISGERFFLQLAKIFISLRFYDLIAKASIPEYFTLFPFNLNFLIQEGKNRAMQLRIACYEAALEVKTPHTHPIECLKIARNLGNLHFNQEKWIEAINVYSIAIDAADQSQSEAIDVYFNLILSCINTQQFFKALEYAERNKSHKLLDLIANRDNYPKGEIPLNILAAYKELRTQILIAEFQSQEPNRGFNQEFLEPGASDIDRKQRLSSISRDREVIAMKDRLVSLKQELDRLITTHIQPVDPSFQLTQKVEPISFEEMRSALPNDRTALVTWYIAQNKLLTFIVTPQATHPQLIESTPEAFQQFIEILTDYQTAYSQYRERINKDWKQALPQYRAQFSQTLGLAEILHQLPPECDRLILIPHRFLHLIPLHALPIFLPDNTETCLLDRFPQGVRYAPSVQLLKLAQQWSRPPLQNLLAVQDPTQDLTFTNLEVTALRTHFQPFDRVFRHKAAQKSALTPELLAQSNCVHFSCHGVFDFANPTQSALMLSESLVTTPDGQKIRDLEKCLTLGEIFTQDLRQCRLVTLSACETGIVDVSKQIDEYIGLPSAQLDRIEQETEPFAAPYHWAAFCAIGQ